MEAFRIAKALRKAEDGAELTIGFIGGSITQDSSASSHEFCYAYRIFKWWQKKFPQSQFTYINAGVGGTTSAYGVARAQRDLLMYRPDFIVVEFSVNDEDTEFFRETFEGLLRRLLKSEFKPAVLVLNALEYRTGSNAQRVHNEIARHCLVPYLSFRDWIWPKLESGEIKESFLTADGLHPNDARHKLMSDAVADFLSRAEGFPQADEPALPPPLTLNRFEDSRILDSSNTRAVQNGFLALKKGWAGRKKGDSISFRISCGNLAIQYIKTVKRPAPVACAFIDGYAACRLDANFTENWGDCMHMDTVMLDNPGVHSVEITVEEPSDHVDFTLLGLIFS
ncbi:MAG: SGNH/GDSL hydrolase family protein [Clostridiales bacterium]|nr:SGNH/GDSL hydrolase family protein [Clostridiales bacterium]